MQFTTILLASLAAASATATSLSPRQDIPACFLTCVTAPGLDTHGCGSTDNLCLCKNPQFVQEQTACIESTCQGDDVATAVSISQQLCEKVGVTLSASSTDAAPTSTAPAASSTEASSTAPAASSTGASVSSAPAASGSSTKAGTSSKPSTTAASSNTASSTSAAPSAGNSNAASSNSGSYVALAALVFGAFAI